MSGKIKQRAEDKRIGIPIRGSYNGTSLEH